MSENVEQGLSRRMRRSWHHVLAIAAISIAGLAINVVAEPRSAEVGALRFAHAEIGEVDAEYLEAHVVGTPLEVPEGGLIADISRNGLRIDTHRGNSVYLEVGEGSTTFYLGSAAADGPSPSSLRWGAGPGASLRITQASINRFAGFSVDAEPASVRWAQTVSVQSHSPSVTTEVSSTVTFSGRSPRADWTLAP